MRLLHLSKCPLVVFPSRILKESKSLISSGLFDDVVVVGLHEDGLPSEESPAENIKYSRFKPPLIHLRRHPVNGLRKLLSFDKAAVSAMISHRPDMIMAHSIATLSSCVKAGRKLGVPVIYDCHELELGTLKCKGLIGKYFTWLERKYLPMCDGVMVVNDSIADWYANRYGIRPLVLKAFPDVRWQSKGAKSNIFREMFGIPEEHTIFIYQGIFSLGRRIEQLIEVFSKVDPSKHLVLMGIGDLEKEVLEAAEKYPNIHFKSIVKPEEVLIYTSAADVGICGIENVCLSYYLCLPNKIMEYIQAEIAIMAPDWPELSRFVREDDCGWLHTEETDEIIALVNSIDRTSAAEKSTNCAKIAPKMTWETQESILNTFVSDIMSRRKGSRKVPTQSAQVKVI